MYSGGNGTKEDPYLIANGIDFYNVRNNANSHFKQVADIDMSSVTWKQPSGYFYGSYDGNGFKMSKLSFKEEGDIARGIFGLIGSWGGNRVEIKNVTVVDAVFEQTLKAGSFIRGFGFLSGEAEFADFYNCHVYRSKAIFSQASPSPGSISHAGGICGSAANCNIENCTVDADISVYSSTYIGGICGKASEATQIVKCRTSGKLQGYFTASGGIVGEAMAGEIQRCSTNVLISGSGWDAGGIAGRSYSAVSECYANTVIQGTFVYVSPFIASLNAGVVTNCFCNGKLFLCGNEDSNTAYVGGIAGRFSGSVSSTGARIMNCYSTCDLLLGIYPSTAIINVGGIVGYDGGGTTKPITRCFSLMNSIATSDTEQDIGRVWGKKTHSTTSAYNNFALDTMTYNNGDFPNENKIHNGKDGADVTIEEARNPATYIAQGWDFENIWGIHPKHNNGLPFLQVFGMKPDTSSDEKYPVVHDEWATDFNNLGLAILDNAFNVKIREVINGEYTLSLVLPRNDPKWEHIKPENIIKVEGQLYRIRSFDEIRDEQGKVLSNVQCEHVWYDANDCKFIPFLELINVNPLTALTAIFSDTPFEIIDCEIDTMTDLFFNKNSPLEAVSQLIENVGGELIRDNYNISLVKNIGKNNGVQFRVGKNVASLKKSVDSRELVTRLYPYGKDGIEITGEYIDSPLKAYYSTPKVRYKDYRHIEDKDELLQAALSEWSTPEKDGIDKPRVTYQVSVVELKKLKECGDFEAFGLGDAVRVADESLEIDTLQRIVEYEYYPYEAKRSNVALINYDVKTYVSNTPSGMLGGMIKSNNQFTNMLAPGGSVDASYLDNIRDKISTEIDAAIQKALVHDRGDMWVDDVRNPTEAMAIIAGKFAIANSKKANGDWDWKTLGDANGFVADAITAGVLSGIQLLIKNGATELLSVYKNANGGQIILNDNDGNLNTKIESESGEGNNIGGTVALFNDGDNRVSIGTIKATDSGQVQVRDALGNLSYINATSGVIKGQLIATLKDIRREAGYSLDYDSLTSTLNLKNNEGDVISSVIIA